MIIFTNQHESFGDTEIIDNNKVYCYLENAKKKELVNLDLLNIDDEQKNEIYSEIDTLKNIQP